MFRLFSRSKNTIKNPVCLVASIGSHDHALLTRDRQIYEHYFTDVEIYESGDVAGFYEFLNETTVDILHLFADVSSDHTIQHESGISFFERLSQANVKIFILASENEVDNLIPFCSQAANAGIAHMNIVMTLDRKGGLYGRFFKSLFGRMVNGKTMPQAWVELAPQNPNTIHEAPEMVFSAGYGSLRLSV